MWGGEDSNTVPGMNLVLNYGYVADPFPNCYVGSGGTGKHVCGAVKTGSWEASHSCPSSAGCGVKCPPGIINSNA